MVESPLHTVVLRRIAAAMEKYEGAFGLELQDGDTGRLKDIALVTRFLKNEASNRVNIKFEYLVVEWFEAFNGSKAVDQMIEYQAQSIAVRQGAEWAAVPDCHKLELEFEEAGLCWTPIWGIESGRASISQQARFRLAMHHLFRQ